MMLEIEVLAFDRHKIVFLLSTSQIYIYIYIYIFKYISTRLIYDLHI